MTTLAIAPRNRKDRRIANRYLGGHDLRGVKGDTSALVCMKCWRMGLLRVFLQDRCEP